MPFTVRGKRLGIALLALFFAACTSEQRVWVTGWQSSPNLQIPRAGAATVATDQFMYVIGGVDGRQFLDSIEVTRVHADGSLSPWTFARPLPEPRGFVDAIIKDNDLYVFGGGNGPYGKNLLASGIKARIHEDGSLGEWESLPSMLTPRRCNKLISFENRIYALGGFSGALLDTVEATQLDSEKGLTPWRVLDNRLTTVRYVNSAKLVGHYAYVLGGHHPEKGVGVNSVEYADLRAPDFQWRETAAMKRGRYGLATVSANNFLFAMGGISGTEYLDSVEVASIGEKGELTTWRDTTPLPRPVTNFTTIKVSDRIYIVGGSTQKTYLANVYSALVNEQGQLGYWGSTQQKQIVEAVSHSSNTSPALPNTGEVTEVIQAEQYTYVHVVSSVGREWVAGPHLEVKSGSIVSYSSGVFMSNFYSRSLQRNFAAIRFVSELQIEK